MNSSTGTGENNSSIDGAFEFTKHWMMLQSCHLMPPLFLSISANRADYGVPEHRHVVDMFEAKNLRGGQ